MRSFLSIIALVCGCSASTTSSGPAPTGDAAISDGATSDASTTASNIEYAAACMAPAACGGVIEGTWSHVSACVQVDAALFCSGSVDKGDGSTISGTITFAEGKTTIAQNVRYLPNFHLGPSCTCPTAAPFDRPCTTGETCICSTNKGNNYTGGVSYTTSGTTLTLGEGSELLSGEFDYCVQGDTLTIRRKVAAKFPVLGVVRFKRAMP